MEVAVLMVMGLVSVGQLRVVERVCGAPLEEAIRPSLMALSLVQALALAPVLIASRRRASAPAGRGRQTPKQGRALQRCVMDVVGGTILFHVVAILFGAPVTLNVEQTLLWSLLMALLIFMPMTATGRSPWLPESWARWPDSPVDTAVLLSSVGSLLGAWVGAFSIPLDWDRPWQPFPISSTYGAIYGHTIGVAIALLVSIAAYLYTHLRSSPTR